MSSSSDETIKCCYIFDCFIFHVKYELVYTLCLYILHHTVKMTKCMSVLKSKLEDFTDKAGRMLQTKGEIMSDITLELTYFSTLISLCSD